MVYLAGFETQRDENAPLPWTNCNLASHAMLLDQWSYGRIQTSDIPLRVASGVDPGLGTNFAQNATAIKRLFALDLRYSDVNAAGNGNAPTTWKQLKAHLAANASAVACGFYTSLRGWTNDQGQAVDRWQPGGTFGHAVHVSDYRADDKTVYWQDPLGHGDYTGDRIPIRALYAFLWKEGADDAAVVTASYTFVQQREEPVADGSWSQKIAQAVKDCDAVRTRQAARIETLRNDLSWGARKRDELAECEATVAEQKRRIIRLKREIAE